MLHVLFVVMKNAIDIRFHHLLNNLNMYIRESNQIRSLIRPYIRYTKI